MGEAKRAAASLADPPLLEGRDIGQTGEALLARVARARSCFPSRKLLIPTTVDGATEQIRNGGRGAFAGDMDEPPRFTLAIQILPTNHWWITRKAARALRRHVKARHRAALLISKTTPRDTTDVPCMINSPSSKAACDPLGFVARHFASSRRLLPRIATDAAGSFRLPMRPRSTRISSASLRSNSTLACY